MFYVYFMKVYYERVKPYYIYNQNIKPRKSKTVTQIFSVHEMRIFNSELK